MAALSAKRLIGQESNKMYMAVFIIKNISFYSPSHISLHSKSLKRNPGLIQNLVLE